MEESPQYPGAQLQGDPKVYTNLHTSTHTHTTLKMIKLNLYNQKGVSKGDPEELILDS